MCIQGIMIPPWLEALNTQKFFVGCLVHKNSKKNENNICCLNCCTSICTHCLPHHQFHRLIQVRRYVYHNVVQLEDLNKFIDCSNVQTYTINNAKVVFIKKRPLSRQFKGLGNICTSCDRALQEPYIHCSLECKVNYVLRQKEDLSSYLRISCETPQTNTELCIRREFGEDEMNETTRSTIIDDEDDLMGSSSGPESHSPMRVKFVQKKRSNVYVCSRSATCTSVTSDDMVGLIKRRKGTPYRSPLC
ncbi:hypothetical protein QJS04_geneDACA003753 [Acorus gramineus]|uniref:B box-type domain-containing protein n=1 Tax=Acorus gramineus TaxID=55184 RepID=A0AAV9BIX7_ACOGR|nr:hypothetical protein QJS04_geneDACA003753 [Acorus gramineus]